jgi:hypothetical protein
MAEEKDLAAIKAKTKEAGKNNGLPILKLVGKIVPLQNKSVLSSLIDPALARLMGKRSPKVVKTTRSWLLSIGEGLADNNGNRNSSNLLLVWLREMLEKEEKLQNQEKLPLQEQPEKKKRKLLVEEKDAFLIPSGNKEKTKGTVPLTGGKISGQYLLTEFTFTVLYNGLNNPASNLRDGLLSNNKNGLELDYFVEKLTHGISAPSKQVNIVSLRLLTLLFEFELPSFKNDKIIDNLRRNGFLAMNQHCYRTTSDTAMSNATFKVSLICQFLYKKPKQYFFSFFLVSCCLLYKISRL